MQQYSGNLKKMKTNNSNIVEYTLQLGDDNIVMNDYIGKYIRIQFDKIINCSACGVVTKKSFGGGFCYSCFTKAPEASECILKPDECKAHLGVSRDMEWSEKHCLTEHVVYLSVTSHVKVGVTRISQVPTRWIDQGASEAIIIAKTPNRHIAGVMEKFLMDFYSDKTSWKKMLSGESNDYDLIKEKEKIFDLLPKELQQYFISENNITKIKYPINTYSDKIINNSFDKNNFIEGILTGIKGQYLIFDNKNVLNIRRHTGYKVNLSFDNDKINVPVQGSLF